jgi:hypothetical protein
VKNTFFIFYGWVTAGLVLTGCRTNDVERPRWDMDIVTPIVKSTLTFEDFAGDTIFTENQDKSLSFVHRQHMYSLGIDSLVKLQVKPFRKKKTVESLELVTDTVKYTITLRDLSEGMEQGKLIRDNEGKPFIFPGVSGLSAGPIDIGISHILKNATIRSGELVMTIDNGLPVGLTNVNIVVNNNMTNHDLIFERTIASIPKRTKQTIVQDLSGKKIEGNMQVMIPSFNTTSSLETVRLDDALTITLVVRNIKVEEATAVFPAQEIINNEANSPLENMGDVKITRAIAKKGKVKIAATTTAQDTIYYTYSIPVATKNGVPFEIKGKLAPGSGGNLGREDKTIDLSGYEIDLRGKNSDTINAIYNVLSARLEHTGREVHFSLSDYIDVSLSLEDLEPSYVEGFLGYDTIMIGPGIQKIDFFKEFESENIKFNDLKVNLEIENGFGSSAAYTIDYLSAANASEEKAISNVATGTFPPATKNPLKPSVTTIPIENTSPAPIELFNLNPEKIGYSGAVYLNKGVPSTDLTGFASDESRVNAWLNLEFPLNVAVKNLRLRDTTELPSTTFNAPVNEGILNLLAWNSYPFDASIQLTFLNKNLQVVDSLYTSEYIHAAPVDIETGRVKETRYSKLSYTVDNAKLHRLLEADLMAIEVTFNSSPAGIPAKIYSDYKIDVKLSGDFNYTVRSK